MTSVADLRSSLADIGQTVTFGAIAEKGYLKHSGAPWGGSEALIAIQGLQLFFVSEDFPGLGPDSTVVIGGATYRITAGPHQSGDGALAVCGVEAL